MTATDIDTDTVLAVRNLTVSFGGIRAVEDVSLRVGQGDIYAIVGESGCGKSTLAYSMLDVVPAPGRITAGGVEVLGRQLTALSRSALNRLRAAEVSIVFQAAMNSFNPVTTIGRQVEDLLEAHGEVFASAAEGRAYFDELLGMVRLPTERIWRSYEHQLSGGMKQRVAIAVALLLHPSILILDEPTTALDVLNQRLVLDALRNLHRELGLSVVFVTHDLAVVAELATRVAVMYAGRLVESGTVDEIFTDARRHPYVAALISAIPSVLARGLQVKPIAGRVPNLAELPSGCRFASRCPLARGICHEAEPPLVVSNTGHAVACHVVNEELTEGIAT